MKKIVVASDSFKGSLGSGEVAAAVARAVESVFPDCRTVCLEMADGGEGTLDALFNSLGGNGIQVEVKDPLGNVILSEYAIMDIPGKGPAAVIEMSKASGLTLVPPALRNPLNTTTFGTGQMISDALDRGCRTFLTGIGGSATNDAGIGMLTALGWRFLDSEGKELPPVGSSLGKIFHIDDNGKDPRLLDCTFKTACDVDTPFCGPEGAAHIFAPQKGAGARQVEILDAGMESFAEVIRKATGTDVKTVTGAGAAGGLGGAFKAFLHSDLLPGAEMVLDAAGFDSIAEGADLVITGEGRLDSQTLLGKAPYSVLRRASKLGIPTVAIAGKVSDKELLEQVGFKDVLCINPPDMTLETAMRPEVARRNVFETVRKYLSTLP